MLRVLFLIGLLSFSGLARAETPEPPDMKDRVKYATFLHDARPLRDTIDKDIDVYAAQVSEAEREDFLRHVQLRIDYDALEEKSIHEMALLYTVPELKAMLAYFGSPEGKAAEAKAPLYLKKMAPEVERALNRALMDTRFGGQPDSGE